MPDLCVPLTDSDRAVIAALLEDAGAHTLAQRLRAHADTPDRLRAFEVVAHLCADEDVADYVIEGTPSLRCLSDDELAHLIHTLANDGEPAAEGVVVSLEDELENWKHETF